MLAGLAFFVLLISSCTFFRPHPKSLYRKAMKHDGYDAIIVPGFPYNGSTWSFTMKSRVLWAVHLYKTGVAKNIIFSGSAVYSPYIESRVMALYAEELGVPKEHIFVEEQAQHSTENVYYSYHLGRSLGFEKMAVASDPVQSKLLMGFANRRFDRQIHFVPYIMSTVIAMDTVAPCIDATAAFTDDFQSIVETQGVLKRFKGTCGWNINYDVMNPVMSSYNEKERCTERGCMHAMEP
jgi:uncharacterized SAM-binding protein YcdF (DUF218 family)